MKIKCDLCDYSGEIVLDEGIICPKCNEILDTWALEAKSFEDVIAYINFRCDKNPEPYIEHAKWLDGKMLRGEIIRLLSSLYFAAANDYGR